MDEAQKTDRLPNPSQSLAADVGKNLIAFLSSKWKDSLTLPSILD